MKYVLCAASLMLAFSAVGCHPATKSPPTTLPQAAPVHLDPVVALVHFDGGDIKIMQGGVIKGQSAKQVVGAADNGEQCARQCIALAACTGFSQSEAGVVMGINFPICNLYSGDVTMTTSTPKFAGGVIASRLPRHP